MNSTLALFPLAAGYFLSYLFRNVNGLVAADIMHDLGIGADRLGQLTSIYFLTFAAAQLPVGVLLDRYGPRRVQGALLLLAAAGSGLCALPTGFAGLVVGRALVGLGTAGGLVAGLKASAELFPRERLPFVNGGYIMCGGLGALAATLPAEFALRLTDWRGLLAGLAAAAAAAALAVRVLVPRPVSSAAAETPVGLGEIVRDPFFRRFAPLSATCFGTVLAIQGLWAGPWLADVEGLSRPEVARDLAYMALVLIVSAPLWGLLTQWLRRRTTLACAVPAAALLLIGAEILVITTHGAAALASWCLFAGFGGMTVLSFSVVADHFPPAAIGRANSMLNVLHVGMSFAVQLGVGQIVALWGPAAGRYPAQAYHAGLLLPLGAQLVTLIWFALPGRVCARGMERGRAAPAKP